MISSSERPATLSGFDHVKRAWNLKLESWVARILPGEYYVTRSSEGISTTLGSCISACIRDRVQGIGGMNHFMLPEGAGDDDEAPEADADEAADEAAEDEA